MRELIIFASSAFPTEQVKAYTVTDRIKATILFNSKDNPLL
jgi:hypothetical protein